MRRPLVALMLLTALLPLTTVTAEEGGVVIEEILVSASSAAYNGTDWNGDGIIGSQSDQYIQIRNTGTEAVDISDWILDDNIGEGSPPCRIGWNTTIEAGEAIVFYRANTGIELDYFDADSANLLDIDGNHTLLRIPGGTKSTHMLKMVACGRRTQIHHKNKAHATLQETTFIQGHTFFKGRL